MKPMARIQIISDTSVGYRIKPQRLSYLITKNLRKLSPTKERQPKYTKKKIRQGLR